MESGLRSLGVNAEPDAKLDAPDYYCPVHNPNPAAYPVSPLYNGESPYDAVEPDEPDEPEETDEQDANERTAASRITAAIVKDNTFFMFFPFR